MGGSFVSAVIATVVLSLSLEVNCQWCTGSTQSKTALDDTVDYIASRHYPAAYSNYLNCVSTIATSASRQVLFYVETQYIEHSYDYLKIYSGVDATGQLLHHSDFNYAPHVGLSSGTNLRADFYSDYSITYGGFKMSFIAVDRDNLPSCGATISATSTFQQLSYVSSSSVSTRCTWTISPTTGTYGVQINMLLVQGDVEITWIGGSTNYYTADSVFVGPSSAQVQVTGNVGNDFVVQYKEVQVSITTTVVTTTTTTTPPVNSICTLAYRTSYEGATQFLVSPNYPGEYPDYQYCTVTITASDISRSVFVTISDYAFATGDGLLIYDGPDKDYNQFSGVGYDSQFTSSGASLFLIFETDSFGQNRGFQLTYQSVTRIVPLCDQSYVLDVNVTSGLSERTIWSPNYPVDYDNYLDKYYLIEKPLESDRIVIDFRVFSVEESTDCVYDYVAIYDGVCKSDPLIAKVCGHSPVTFEDSSGLYILIEFHTDYSVTFSGWVLSYYIGSYDASAATGKSSSGINDYIYPIIGICVVLSIAAVLVVCLYCSGKGRVTVVQTKPVLKRRTTHDLLTEMANRSDPAQTDQRQKIKRKEDQYHPRPYPPGPNINVIQLGAHSPHPPPGMSDPVYPPEYLNVGTHMPTHTVAPVLTDQTRLTPTAPIQVHTTPSMISPPFQYLTPAEARAVGMHQ